MFYPTRFETDSWYNDIAIVSPFWAYSDEYVMDTLKGDFPEATTKVYYHEYTASLNADSQTKAMIARAKSDVEDSGMCMSFIARHRQF